VEGDPVKRKGRIVREVLMNFIVAWSMGHGAWGMEHGAWGMGHGAWGMGHGEWGMVCLTGQAGGRWRSAQLHRVATLRMSLVLPQLDIES
jgi:hypothetical protein